MNDHKTIENHMKALVANNGACVSLVSGAMPDCRNCPLNTLNNGCHMEYALAGAKLWLDMYGVDRIFEKEVIGEI